MKPATHEMGFAEAVDSRLIFMDVGGRILENGSTDDFFSHCENHQNYQNRQNRQYHQKDLPESNPIFSGQILQHFHQTTGALKDPRPARSDWVFRCPPSQASVNQSVSRQAPGRYLYKGILYCEHGQGQSWHGLLAAQWRGRGVECP